MPSAKKPNWRLRKALTRKLEFRPIEDEDIRYAWVAYRDGALNTFPKGLIAHDFKVEFQKLIVGNYDAAWVLLAETRKGFIPVGLALGFWPHQAVSHFLIFNNFVWFPWASPRNRIESAANFFEKIRDEIPMMGFERHGKKGFCDVLAKLGLLKRVGTSMNVFGDEAASVWETRR